MSNSHHGSFTPGKEHTEKEAGWNPEMVWKFHAEKNLLSLSQNSGSIRKKLVALSTKLSRLLKDVPYVCFHISSLPFRRLMSTIVDAPHR